MFLVDGVLHAVARTEEWFDAFQNEAAQLGEAMEAERADSANRQEAEQLVARRQLIRMRAAELRADPLFTARKISAEKRHYLASRLFPELDRQTINAIVDEAINSEWFEQGRTPPSAAS